MSLEIVFILILLFICCVSSYYAVKFGLLLLSLEDDIEESLDDLDESFKALTEILQKPIFFDSLEVRQCISEIRRCRNTVIKIADRLTSFGNNSQIGEESKYDNDREKEDN